MRLSIKKAVLVFLPAALLCPTLLPAQNEEGKKEKEAKKSAEQIIITRKSDSDKKMVIEIDGDKVLVNGKPASEDKDVSVHRSKIRDVWAYSGDAFNSLNTSLGKLSGLTTVGEDRALLGVTTEQNESGKGVKVLSVTKESAAAKAGLKEGDIITKIGDKAVGTPDDLSDIIRDHKPGDKVTVTYLRDKKENKASAELTKWKGMVFGSGGQNYFTMPDMNFEHMLPRIEQYRAAPRAGIVTPRGSFSYSWTDNSTKLGLSVQDTEDGKGVKVLEADEDGNGAKAGIKEGDIITEVDGKAIKNTDEIAKIMKESKDKISVKMKLQRNGKTENVEVKVPRKLKKTDL
ncbi:MAG TPA: PDZ domain-containing protein [Chitinophagaceae bacterium]|nr:PDZ domain-containing protein [Chitinophagaceae bacterium]